MEERFDTIDCERIVALAPTYVDGEVRSEATASAVRRHLIDCASCRAAVQDETTLRQWFVPTEEVEVPEGFASRVARRAFAGDTGESSREGDFVLRPVAPSSAALEERRRFADFAIALTAVAAAALILVTLMIASDERAGVDANGGLSAGPQLDEQLRALEAENRVLEAGARRPSAVSPRPAAGPAEGAEAER